LSGFDDSASNLLLEDDPRRGKTRYFTQRSQRSQRINGLKFQSSTSAFAEGGQPRGRPLSRRPIFLLEHMLTAGTFELGLSTAGLMENRLRLLPLRRQETCRLQAYAILQALVPFSS
jgi:hypothetical protein